MKSFAKKIIVFSIPIFVFFALIVIIDPYSYWGFTPSNEKKVAVAKRPDSFRRYSFINYYKHPKKNIIVGSSQLAKIQVENLPCPQSWSQLSVGGATLSEEVYNFWKAVEISKPDTVLFSVDPYNYAAARDNDQVFTVTTKAWDVAQSPFEYLLDKTVWEACFDYLFSKETDSEIHPGMTREQFWAFQLEQAKNRFSSPNNGERIKEQLTEIVKYCDENNIVIVAIVPLVHNDVYCIGEVFIENVFIPDMVNIFGRVFDFCYSNDYTKNKDNYGDPFHAYSDSLYISGLWKDDTSYCRIVLYN